MASRREQQRAARAAGWARAEEILAAGRAKHAAGWAADAAAAEARAVADRQARAVEIAASLAAQSLADRRPAPDSSGDRYDGGER